MLKTILILASVCLLTPVEVHSQTVPPSTVFQKARTAFAAGDSATALTLMENVVTAEPKNPEALAWLGFLYVRSGAVEKAVTILEQAIALKPTTPDVGINLANALLALPKKTAAQTTRAVSLLEQALKLNPAAFEAYNGLGHTAFRNADYAKAVAMFRRVTELNPNDATAYINLGLALSRRGQDTDAIVTLRKAVTIQPTLIDGWITIAQLEFKTGKNNAAYLTSAKALTLSRKNVDALLIHAQSAAAINRDEEAQESYGILADIYVSDDTNAARKSDPSARYNQGILLVRLNRLADALIAFEAAAVIDPKHSDTAQNIGTVLYTLTRYPEALTKFQLAAEYDSKSPAKWRNVALAAHKTKDVSVEVGALRKAVALDTTDVLSRQLLAPILVSSGRAADAIPIYKQLSVLQPRSAAPLITLANLLIKQDQLDAALVALKDATAREPLSAAAWNNLGVLYERRGQINDAIASYKAAVKASPNDADAKSNLARFGKSTTGSPKPE